MAFLEYMLLALLGTAGAATPGGTPARTFTADAVTQPSGGTEVLLTQDTPPKKSSRHREARRRHRGHRHGKDLTGKKATKS